MAPDVPWNATAFKEIKGCKWVTNVAWTLGKVTTPFAAHAKLSYQHNKIATLRTVAPQDGA